MDSKLQKPSFLKRPTPLAILPMDRIRAAVPAFGSRQLSRDVANMPASDLVKRDRAASPDLLRTNSMQTRAKLRRSRSACDIREMRPTLKRTESTLAPIPDKSARLIGGSTIASTSRPLRTATTTAVSHASINKRPALSANRNNISVTKMAMSVVGNRTAPASVTTAKKTTTLTSSNSSSSTRGLTASTTGAGKTINKRIPPYDYKARFNDLLEKHKIIKEKLEEKNEMMSTYETLPEQLEESQAQLFTTQEQLKNVTSENDCLHQQVTLQTKKIETITDGLVKAKEESKSLLLQYNKIKTEHGELSVEVVELRSRNLELTTENADLLEELAACKEQLFRSNIDRKELHNMVLDLKGNIRVFCRVRPPLDFENNKPMCGWNYIDEATLEIQNPDLIGKNKASAHMFSFDYVFHPGSRQDDIFEMVSPLIQSALDGYNICIFAYGQTGSGKTYTMDGIPSNPGVIPRTVDLLFDSVNNYKRLGWEYEIKVTFLEIYNEVLYDLLSNEQKDMEIRMAKNKKNDVYVTNITEETVSTSGRLRELMNIAKMNRATAATAGNERSSRSHAVTKIELIGRHEEKNEISLGSINLVDLAGSESPKTSIRMNETKNINRSLSELTNVILALLQKQDHIPYRNSKLTHLLMPSLGGNSKTLMFINVAPFLDCFVESVKSLRFAASVNSCKMAKAKRNRVLSNAEFNSSTAGDK